MSLLLKAIIAKLAVRITTAEAVYVADAVTMAEDLVTVWQAVYDLADDLTMDEALTVAHNANLGVDTVTMSEVAVILMTFSVSLADAATLTDDQAFAVTAPLTDASMMIDGLASDMAIPLGDSASMADDNVVVMDYSSALSDSVAMTEVIAADQSVPLSDSATMSDVFLTGVLFEVAPADSVATSDAAVYDFTNVMADSMTASEDLVVALQISQAINTRNINNQPIG